MQGNIFWDGVILDWNALMVNEIIQNTAVMLFGGGS